MKTIYLLFVFIILFVFSCSDEAKALANCTSLTADLVQAQGEYNPDPTSDGFSDQTAEECQAYGDAYIAWFDAGCEGTEEDGVEELVSVYREPAFCESLHP